MQQILWTLLPNGVQNGRVRFSVLVSPRLSPRAAPATLAQYPDFLDWPRAVANLRFNLRTEGSLNPNGLVPMAERSSAFWQALFPRDLPVRPFSYQDYSQRPVRCYPATELEETITQPYRRLATAGDPTRPPDLETMRGLCGQMAMTTSQRAQMHGLMNGALRQEGRMPAFPPDDLDMPDGMGPQNWMLAAAEGFHRADADPRRPPMAPPTMEFHDLIGVLVQYPNLCRRLGLIFDLEVPATGDWGKSASVIPVWQSSLPTSERSEISIVTHLDAENLRSFRVFWDEETDDFKDGLLRLSNQRLFRTTLIETGQAALRMLEFATSFSERNEPYLAPPPPDRPYDTPGERRLGLPSLRTDGIALNRNDLASYLRTQFFETAALNESLADGWALLFGRHLIRGYRIDVREIDGERPGPWRSLCRRRGTFRLVRGGLTWEAPEDEGWVTLGAAAPTAPPVLGETRIHETLFRWLGWSLCAGRPGSAMLPDGSVAPGNVPAPGLDLLRADVTVPPGSLPMLRFGRRYQFRARVVDLAGNSLPLSDPADTEATPPVRYARLQPIPAPVVVPRSGLAALPGESVDRLVIRTAVSEQGAPVGVPQASERHVVAPQIAPQMAEWHGQFDTAAGAMSPTSYDVIAARSGSLKEVHPEEQIPLPYLADPLARGAALAGLPGADREVMQISFWPAGSRWPDGRSFRVRLVGGSAPPQWDEARRVLTVSLPPAETAQVDLSCYLGEADLPSMGVWEWVEERDPDNKAELKRRALQGCHWMLTPCRRLTLVHAVQRPLVPPSFRRLSATRGPGSTAIALVDERPMPISGKSTVRLDIEARWTDPVDNPAERTWRRIPVRAHAATLFLAPDQTQLPFHGQVRHDLGDTKRRVIQYQAVATTRFREYFPVSEQEVRAGARSITRGSSEVAVDVPSSAAPAAPEVLYVVPTFAWREVRRGRETVRERRGNGLRVYLKRGWFSSGEGELLGIVFQQEGYGSFRGVSGRLEGLVTRWGIDPVTNVGPPAGPSWDELRGAFRSAVYIGENLELREAETDLTLGPVAVAGHEVRLDTERDLLYCDIEIDARAYYMPFVRLALARVQPHSIPGMHLSSVVRTDFAQLAPDRVASVVVAPHGGSATVTVTGIAQATDLDTYYQRGAVEVQLETRIDGVPEDELAWRPYTEFQEVPEGLFPEVNGGEGRWTNTIELPPPGRRPGPLRLAIREYEQLDPSSTFDDPNSYRLVYADTLLL